MAYIQKDSPLECWKGFKRVPGTKKGSKGSCKKPSPLAKGTKGGGTKKVCLPKACAPRCTKINSIFWKNAGPVDERGSKPQNAGINVE